MSVKILVDVGEVPSGLPGALEELRVSIELRRLEAGDYLVGARESVERKTVHDLHRSIATGRLWRQLEKLRAECDRAWLLVEGTRLDAGRLSHQGVRGALLAVVDTGVPLLWSGSREDSAQWLMRLAHRAASASRGAPVWKPRSPRRRAPAKPSAVLCVVAGISPRLADSLLREFGSIQAIASASPEALRLIEGIGEARARSLLATLTGEPS